MAASTWIVVHDSIMDGPAGGVESGNALHLVAEERNVCFKKIGSSGAALGATDLTGFNNDDILPTIDRIGGAFSAYKGIIIQAGTNDFGRSIPWEDMVASMRRILDKVRAAGKKAIVMDPIYRDGETVSNPTVGYNLGQYRFLMAIVATQEYPDVCYYASRTNTIFNTTNSHYDAAEVTNNKRLHLNTLGHRRYADWLKAVGAASGWF